MNIYLLAGIMWNTQGCSCRPTKLLPKQKIVPYSSCKMDKNEQITLQLCCSNFETFANWYKFQNMDWKLCSLWILWNKTCIGVIFRNKKNVFWPGTLVCRWGGWLRTYLWTLHLVSLTDLDNILMVENKNMNGIF